MKKFLWVTPTEDRIYTVKDSDAERTKYVMNHCLMLRLPFDRFLKKAFIQFKKTVRKRPQPKAGKERVGDYSG